MSSTQSREERNAFRKDDEEDLNCAILTKSFTHVERRNFKVDSTSCTVGFFFSFFVVVVVCFVLLSYLCFCKAFYDLVLLPTVKLMKGNDTARQTRDTTTNIWIAYGSSNWHARKYNVHQLHQTYILMKGCPQWHMIIPSISSTLGDTGVYRHATEPNFIRDRT